MTPEQPKERSSAEGGGRTRTTAPPPPQHEDESTRTPDSSARTLTIVVEHANPTQASTLAGTLAKVWLGPRGIFALAALVAGALLWPQINDIADAVPTVLRSSSAISVGGLQVDLKAEARTRKLQEDQAVLDKSDENVRFQLWVLNGKNKDDCWLGAMAVQRRKELTPLSDWLTIVEEDQDPGPDGKTPVEKLTCARFTNDGRRLHEVLTTITTGFFGEQVNPSREFARDPFKVANALLKSTDVPAPKGSK